MDWNWNAVVLGVVSLILGLLIDSIGMDVSHDTQAIITFMFICTGIISFTQINKGG